MRRRLGVFTACAAACALWLGCAATSGQAGTGWKIVHSVGGGFSLAVPTAWSLIPPDKSTPGVVLDALDLRHATATGPLGVQVVVVPGPGSSLAAFSARVVSSVRKQPLVGGVAVTAVRLSVGPARLLRYRVHTKPQDIVVDDYALAVGGRNVLVTFLVPNAKVGDYAPVFARSVASLRAH
jgi:hypothetical protein